MTCPVILRVIEQDIFEEQVQDIDPTAEARRAVFGNFVVACANGNCPGQGPRLANQIVKQSRGEDTSET